MVTGAYIDKKIVGYIVFKINRFDPAYPIGYILELQYFPSRFDVASSLLKDSLTFFDREDVNVIYTWVLRNQSLLQVFTNEGFLNSRRDQEVTVRSLNPDFNQDTLLSLTTNAIEYNFVYSDWI